MEQIALVIISALGGGAGIVPLVNGIKKWLKLQGPAAAALTVVVSIVVGALVSWSQGEFLPSGITWETVIPTLIGILGASQVVYRWWETRPES
jgi:hypothetical protein